MLYNGLNNSQKLPMPWGTLNPSNTWFLGLTRVSHPNNISIGSAVLAGHICVTNKHKHTDRQTDTQTDHATCDNRLHLIHWVHAMQPNNKKVLVYKANNFDLRSQILNMNSRNYVATFPIANKFRFIVPSCLLISTIIWTIIHTEKQMHRWRSQTNKYIVVASILTNKCMAYDTTGKRGLI